MWFPLSADRQDDYAFLSGAVPFRSGADWLVFIILFNSV
jgi:hypothetical protein